MYGKPAASITAAEAAALTSSSQLVSLKLSDKPGQLHPEAYASLFPPGRQLNHLTTLWISADILSHAAALHQAGSCCPNLQNIRFHWPEPCSQDIASDFGFPWEAGEVDLVAQGLEAMSGWSQLRSQRLEARGQQFTTPVWKALGTLSQLTSLHVHCMPERRIGVSHSDAMHLEGCRGLRSLGIFTEDYGIAWVLDIRSTVSFCAFDSEAGCQLLSDNSYTRPT